MTDEQYQTLIRVDTHVTQLFMAGLDTERRLRSLEKARNWAVGVIVFVASLFGITLK